MLNFHRPRPFEETLGRDGEKLGQIGGSVVIDQRRLAPLGLTDQPQEFRLGDAIPAVLHTPGQVGNAIDMTIEAVKKVGELMEHDVQSARLIVSGSQDLLPRQDDGPAMPELTEQVVLFGIVAVESPLCQSGQVLQGLIKPSECGAFGKECTPRNPLGAPMVSSEGACAAYYQFRRIDSPVSA